MLSFDWPGGRPTPSRHRKTACRPGNCNPRRVVHWLLYLLLFALPVLGWINASWRGFPVIMFGLELPKLVGTRVPGWGWTGDVHGILANYGLLVLVGLHVAAALYHYFVRRDGVLQRMLPGQKAIRI